MMKEYQTLAIKVVLFATQDIVTLSDNQKDDVGDDIFG